MTLPRLPLGLIEALGALGRVADLEATTGGAANLTLNLSSKRRGQ